MFFFLTTDFFEHVDWTTQLLSWSWSSQPWVHPSHLDTSPNSALWVVLPRLHHLTPQHEFLFKRIHFVFTL